jgi:multidrug efflux system membrane fusion protein
MRFKPQYVVAGAIPAVVILYFVVRGLLGGHGAQPQAHAATAPDTPVVQVSLIAPQLRPYAVLARGRTQAARIVSVRSETSGVVAATPVREGSFVRAGQVLCKLNVDAREAALEQAQANLRSKQLTQKASAELAARGFRSPTQALADQANLDQAAAAVRQAEVDLRRTDIRAPFAGVFNQRSVEVGAYLSPGGECGVVMELDPLKIVGDVPETEVAKLRVGAPAHAVLASGERLDGVVYYVAKDADPQTRTYPVVMVAHNPGSAVRGGLSAEISIDTGEGLAHLAPSSALVLDTAGRQGVRYVGPGGMVGFAPVRIIDETSQGVWVTGLTGAVRVITVGQSYVSEGQRVRVAAR